MGAMRCPHCAGDIPAGSRFCGICGRNITISPGGELSGGDAGGALQAAAWPALGAPGVGDALGSMSLFELPVSRGARTVKLALVLLLDAVLAGAGIVMIWTYLAARHESPPAPPAPRPERHAFVLAPRTVTIPVAAASPAPAASARAGQPLVKELPGTRHHHRGPAQVAPPSRSKGTASSPGTASSLGAASPASSPDPPAAKTGADAGASVTPAAGGDEGEPDVEGAARQLRVVVDTHQAQLERCYERAAKTAGPSDPLAGRITMRFTLMPDGTIANVRPTGNTTGSESLADCVAGLLGTWALPGGAGDPIELEWPFLFRPPAQP